MWVQVHGVVGVGGKKNEECEVGLSPHDVTKATSSVAITNDVAAHQCGCSVIAAVQLGECRQAVMMPAIISIWVSIANKCLTCSTSPTAQPAVSRSGLPLTAAITLTRPPHKTVTLNPCKPAVAARFDAPPEPSHHSHPASPQLLLWPHLPNRLPHYFCALVASASVLCGGVPPEAMRSAVARMAAATVRSLTPSASNASLSSYRGRGAGESRTGYGWLGEVWVGCIILSACEVHEGSITFLSQLLGCIAMV